jgi:hypothetical protein
VIATSPAYHDQPPQRLLQNFPDTTPRPIVGSVRDRVTARSHPRCRISGLLAERLRSVGRHSSFARSYGSLMTLRWREGDSNPRSPRRIDDAQRAPFRLCGTSCPPGEPSRFTRWRRFESHLPLPAKLLGNEFTRVPPNSPGFGGVLRVHELSSAGSLPGMQSAARRSRTTVPLDISTYEEAP